MRWRKGERGQGEAKERCEGGMRHKQRWRSRRFEECKNCRSDVIGEKRVSRDVRGRRNANKGGDK